MIKHIFLRTTRLIWRLLPWKPARRFLYGTLLWSLRGRKRVAIVGGITFDLDLSESIDVAIFLEGYEKDVRAAIDRHCHAGAVVLDVGANIGAHALYLAKKVGNFGRVYAFEPADYAFKKLERNIGLNRYTHLESLKIALSDRNVEMEEVQLRSSWRTDGTRVKEIDIVACMKMDDWCGRRGVGQIDLIKLDVDGHECAILRGGETVIRKSTPIVILEIGAWHFDRESTNPLLFLSTLGYDFEDAALGAKYDDIHGIRMKLPETDPDMTFSINIVARPSIR